MDINMSKTLSEGFASMSSLCERDTCRYVSARHQAEAAPQSCAKRTLFAFSLRPGQSQADPQHPISN